MKDKVIGNNTKDMGRDEEEPIDFPRWISIHLKKGNRYSALLSGRI